jgi:crotonobetainyl-CoA:carnitine CoA-transferase CaiB-like acyl-CoA transferase
MSAAPLAGLLVVDLSRLLPGPLAARLLADLGARVVKVEEPRLGDPVRLAPPLVGGESALGSLLLAGVESVALDLKKEGAREVLLALLARADVLLDTFRPGTLERLGLAPAMLAERFPKLVHCSLTGWGGGGPYAGRAGHDLTYQAAAGTLAPTAAMPAAPWADVAGAWSAVAAILAALVERGRTGRGGRVEAALYDAAVHANLLAWAEEADRPHAVGEPLALAGGLACYNLYRSADGVPIALAALEPHFWRRFCAAAGAPGLRRLHLRRDPAARRAVAAVIAARPAAEWAALAAEHDLPLEPVRSAAEAAAHPQAAPAGVLAEGPGGLRRLAFPARFAGSRPPAAAAPPALGADTDRLLAELGVEIPLSRRRTAGVGSRLGIRRFLARLLLWARRERGARDKS